MKIKFSQSVVNSFAFSDKKIIHYDLQQKYLAVIIGKHSITYTYIRRIGNTIKYIKIADCKNLSYKDACAEVYKISSGIDAGTFFKESTKTLSLAGLFDLFVQSKIARNHSKRGVQCTVQRLKVYVPPELKAVDIDKIKPAQIENIILNVGQTVGHRTANLLLMDIKAAYNYYIRLNPGSVINPASNCTRFDNVQRSRFLSNDELKRFFAALEESESADFKDFIKIAIFTGKRRSNVLAMQWRHIDMTAARWTIPAAECKNRREDCTLLNSAVVDILKRRPHSGDYVFANPAAKCGHYSEPKTAFAALCRRAHLDDLRIHDLRRTLAAYLAGNNTSLHMIANILGQSGTGATPIYARFADAPKRQAIDSAVDAISRAGGLIIDPADAALKRIIAAVKSDKNLLFTIDRLIAGWRRQ